MKRTIRLNENQLRRIVSESVKRVITETSNSLLQRASEKAHYDRMHNNDYGVRKKRDRQYNTFRDELIRREQESKNSVCPSVPKSDLKNMPKDTYVVLDGNGRDFYWNILRSYSGHAGTKEQCMEYANTFYDKYANWEYLPLVVSLEDYFKNYA